MKKENIIADLHMISLIKTEHSSEETKTTEEGFRDTFWEIRKLSKSAEQCWKDTATPRHRPSGKLPSP